MFQFAHKISFCLKTAAILLLSTAAGAQQTSNAPEDSFSLDAAILDTAIPFAVGAHEARQELRGAFGWPTFQEGLVQGVYFRFDPDGYARFSPTPRLDTDVFEVICRPRTHVCMARKDSLALTLNSRGQIQIQLENVTDADEFRIAEGISELQLPNNILQPLDSRMELLLSSGGDLVVSRAKKEVDRISLKGFSAVTSYLRWVTAQQSYTVLPRDWPVPNSGSATADITSPLSWASPMPKPLATETNAPDAEVAEVRGELRILRELLLKGEQRQDMPDNQEAERLLDLQRALDALALEIEGLKSEEVTMTREPLSTNEVVHWEKPQQVQTPTNDLLVENDAQLMARRMEYLMSEIGLEPEVALMLLKQGSTKPPEFAESNSQNVVDDLLNDLRSSFPVKNEPQPIAPAPLSEEYLLLTDYFKSVFPNE